ncbi:MAG TPA: TIR domain-containing protein, partial [Ktedonobacterales bacterium]|nr:TIR domain-containing protein [Ktedonobacterales bacterium]
PGLEDPKISAGILPRALTLVENSRKAGGWGNQLSQVADAIGTGYCTYLLNHMNRAKEAGQGINWLLRSQAYDGSWEAGPTQSPIEATAWAVLSLLSSANRKAPRVSGAIQSGLTYLLNHYISRAGWPERPGGAAKLWTTYYACLAILAQIDAWRDEKGGGGFLPSRRRKKVFIVHGHQPDLRNEVKQLVIKAGLDPVILEDQPNRGMMTILDKFEYYAREGVDFAVILCTADDMVASDSAMVPRGNVEYELGWLSAKLGRDRVCILWDSVVKLPSDLDGVAKIDMRKEGWRDKASEELRLFVAQQEATDDEE